MAGFRSEPDPMEDLDDPTDNPAAATVLSWSRQNQEDCTVHAQNHQNLLNRLTE